MNKIELDTIIIVILVIEIYIHHESVIKQYFQRRQ
jgi:hypothetical protein